MNQQLIVFIIIFLAVFTQSMAGFGFPLVAMALLPAILGIHVVTPLVALLIVTMEVFLLYRYWDAINFKTIFPIILIALVGIPIGILISSHLDDNLVMALLGVVLTGYAIYALLNEFTDRIRLPDMKDPIWAYVVGFFAGILGGAYNTAGPIVIIYGNCRRWSTAEFKGNMQAFFMVTSLVSVLGHAWNGGLTPEVWHYYLWAIPAMVAGLIAGVSMDKHISPQTFRRVVLLVLGVMGVNLVRMF